MACNQKAYVPSMFELPWCIIYDEPIEGFVAEWKKKKQQTSFEKYIE